MNQNLTFGGVNTADYGIYLTGTGTFSAPERDVEYVGVPGRNGDLLIDNGRWKNIEVTYPANIPREFEHRLPEYRARICAKRGYQRLEDTYHPDEYRMASFTSGLQPEPTPLNRGGQFNLVFNCKPQRFLKSGEIPIQFMPWVPTTYRTQYIPAIEADAPSITVHCKDTDTLGIRYETYNSSFVRTSYNTGSLTDGQTLYGLVTSGDAYWRFEIESGVTDATKTWCKINANTTFGGKPFVIDAVFSGQWVYQNPTGYASKPMIECYGDMLPYSTIENYIDGTRQYYYSFNTSTTGKTHFYMDCELQYLYDDQMNNITDKLYLTTTGSDPGAGMVFPEMGPEEILITMYYPTSDTSNGLGIVYITPRWWTL